MRWWRWAVGGVVLAAGLRYAVRFPWTDTWSALASADWSLLAAASVANLLSLATKAWGWHLMLRPLAPVRARTAQAATFAGAAVGSISIALSGEATRMHLVSQWDGVGAGAAARSIAASRVVEAAALGVFIITLGGSVVGIAGAGGRHGWRLVVGALALAAVALTVLRRLPWLRPRDLGGGSAAGYTTRQLVAPLALGVASWLLQWVTYHWSIAATHPAVTPSESALALLLSNLGGIFRLTPGNVGIVQGAVVLGLAPAGVPASQAVAAGLALQAAQVVPVLLIGVVILGRHGVRRAVPPRSAETA